MFAALRARGRGAERVQGEFVKAPAQDVVPIPTAMENMIAAAINRQTVRVPRPTAPAAVAPVLRQNLIPLDREDPASARHGCEADPGRTTGIF